MSKLSTISYVIIANGLYDILCSFSILKIVYIPMISPILGTLHLNMIKDYTYNDGRFERFFAYYILINGLIRTLGGLCLSDNNTSAIVFSSYLLESVFILNETFFQDTVILEKGLFVSTTSLILAGLSLNSHIF